MENKAETKIFHHSTSSSIQIRRTYLEEVEQGKWEYTSHSDWYDYEQIKDLYDALQEEAEGNLEWLLK